MAVIIPDLAGIFRGAGSRLASLGKTRAVSAYWQSLKGGMRQQPQDIFLERRGKSFAKYILFLA
jgi:hypothetical protein